MSTSLVQPSPGSCPRLCRIFLVLVLSYGALLRMDRLVSNPGFVSPDALRHFIAAEELHADDPMGWFSVYRGYAPFAWAVRFVFGLSSHQPIIQRLVTVALSVLVIWLVARIVQARLGNWAGLFAAYLTAINPALIGSADSGIREDPYAALWLTLFVLVFVWLPWVSPPHPNPPPPGGRERGNTREELPTTSSPLTGGLQLGQEFNSCPSWTSPSPLAGEGWGGGGWIRYSPSPSSLRRISIGLVACLLFLVRVDSLLPLAGFMVLAMWSEGVWRKPMEWCQTLVPIVLLFGMVLLSNGVRHDDPFYFVDREKSMFRYWANLEFKGQPGFPSVEEVRTNCRTGKPLSAFQYFGGILGWRETASRFLKGYAALLGKHVLTGIYRFDAFPNQISFAGILTVTGILVELRRKRWVLPVLIPLLFSGTAWTYHIVGGHDFRFFLVAVPFAIIAACEGAGFLWIQLRGIPQVWLRRALGYAVLGLVLYNPWNHDRKTSFPWRVGPVETVPASCVFDSSVPAQTPSLAGVEFSQIGPLGLWEPELSQLAPWYRFLARTWWRSPQAVQEEVFYRVTTFQEGKGYLGATRYQPLTRKYPLRYWQRGQVILDEVECWVYSRPAPGPVQLRVEVASGDGIKGATYTTVFTQP